MARNYCTYTPSKGAGLFNQLKKEYGYATARGIFLRAISPSFIDDHKDTLSLDAEGIPTYDSIMKTPFMKTFIGTNTIATQLQKNYPEVENTIDNYGSVMQAAQAFNMSNSNNDVLTAIVETTDDDKLRVKIIPKTEQAVSVFNDQYSTYSLNKSLADYLSSLGISIGMLSREEQAAGRIGVTDFSNAKDVANGIATIIKVANNDEGARAITEEAAHTIIGLMRTKPFIERSINMLSSDEDSLREVLGDDYEDVVEYYDGNMDLVAEEALGHLLRDRLISNNTPPVAEKRSIIKRAFDWLINQFKKFTANDVYTIINNADASMDQLAKDILNKTLQIDKDDVSKAQRDAKFNALSDRIEHQIQLLKTAENIETKRAKIATKGSKSALQANKTFLNLKAAQLPDADVIKGLFEYAHNALTQLRSLNNEFYTLGEKNQEQTFSFFRKVRMFTQSYGGFLTDLQDAIIEEETESSAEGVENRFLRDFEVGGEKISLGSVVKDLNGLIQELNRKFMHTATPAFAKILEPFIGKEITIDGKQFSVESLLKKAPKDIGFFDRWLDSPLASNDVILQGISQVLQKAHDDARIKTIEDARTKIYNWAKKAEKSGITTFEWMFEKDRDGHKTGNYISDINYGQFEKDLDEFNAKLEEKYGKNPKGDKLKAKMLEREAWMDAHAYTILGQTMPREDVYTNPAYQRLTDTQRELLAEYLDMKESYDKLYPSGKASRLTAIQNRKSGGERLLQSISSPTTLINNLKEMVSSAILEREDDDQEFGDRARKGLTDFAGNEFLTLPILYTNRLKNPDELSTDVVASLMAYAFAANTYNEMDKVVDPIEVGRAVLTEREIPQTRGNKFVKETYTIAGQTVTNPLKKKRSYFEAKLNDIVESQMYGRYLQDEGTFNLFGKQVNKSKLTSLLLKGSSWAQLGFNWLANTANVFNGIAMQNIEAFTGQYFTAKTLAKADAEYTKALGNFIPQIGARVQNNKLALFFELFNIKQDYARNVKNTQRKNLLLRIFGANTAFLLQEGGDHWLYGRTAIAMALEKKVLLDGRETTLWDALKVESADGDFDIKQLNWRKIKNLDGSDFKPADFGNVIHKLNDRFFGVYNEEGANAANRISMGRLLQQYRKWMRPLFKNRFGEKREDTILGTEEGYYRTIGRLALELVRGEVKLGELGATLTENDRYNIRRAVIEMGQFLAVWALANWFEWPDDKNRPWAVKMAEYCSKRLAHELGSLAPSPVMLQEMIATVKQPIPSISVIEDTRKFLFSVADPRDWVTEVESGPYKGLTVVEKNALRAPILRPWKQVEKFTGELDSSIKYFAR